VGTRGGVRGAPNVGEVRRIKHRTGIAGNIRSRGPGWNSGGHLEEGVGLLVSPKWSHDKPAKCPHEGVSKTGWPQSDREGGDPNVRNGVERLEETKSRGGVACKLHRGEVPNGKDGIAGAEERESCEGITLGNKGEKGRNSCESRGGRES